MTSTSAFKKIIAIVITVFVIVGVMWWFFDSKPKHADTVLAKQPKQTSQNTENRPSLEQVKPATPKHQKRETGGKQTTDLAEQMVYATNHNYYSVIGSAKRDYAANPDGTITYCPLDNLQRPTCAYAQLTVNDRTEAKKRGRQPIDVDPAGWPKNFKAVIGSYRGWFWNRSHMIADSLGGDPIKENLVTGTRTQNVGSSRINNGGMAYTETKARAYLDDKANANCPLYYAVTPKYDEMNQIPTSVIVDIESCDKSISERVLVPNTAKGWLINYENGHATKQ